MDDYINDRINFWELYNFLNKEEFIELLSKYHHVDGQQLILIKANQDILFKISVCEIYNSPGTSIYCKRFIYDTFIKKWQQRNKDYNKYIDKILIDLEEYINNSK